MKRLLTIAAMVATIGLLGCGGGDSGGGDAPDGNEAPVLRFTAIPDDNTTELLAKYTPVAEYLAAELGVAVEYVPASDYGASVEMFKHGNVHLAWFGGLTGVQARQAVDGARAIVQGAEDPEYFSYFIANPASGLEPSDDFPTAIREKKFTFGSTKSTSGRLMPEHFIKKFSGLGPDEFFAQPYGFSGSHDQTIVQVAAGAYDVGAVSYKTFDAKVAEGKVDAADVQVIWRTPPYADYNFTAHPELESAFGPGFTNRLQQVLVGIQDPALLGAFRRSALIPATNEEFGRILEVARSLDLAR